MAVKIITSYVPAVIDLGYFKIDLSRKTAVLIRQSMKKADISHYESRLLQENLVPTAIKIRGDADGRNILVFDEGAGVSGTKGYDEREKLWRGTGVRGKEGWSTEEDEIIKTYWPTSHPLEIMRLLPTRSIVSVSDHALELGVYRTVRTGGKRVNPYDRAMTYADLEAAMAQAEEEDKEYICGIVNDMAEKTARKELSVYWPLPVDKVGFCSILADDGEESTEHQPR